jgi:hypothetical protein
MEEMKKIQGGKGPRPMGEGGGEGIRVGVAIKLIKRKHCLLLHIFLDFRFRLVS